MSAKFLWATNSLINIFMIPLARIQFEYSEVSYIESLYFHASLYLSRPSHTLHHS
jgi:hypothetical protein